MALKFETWLEAHSDENVLVTSFHWGLSSLVSTRDPPKLTFVVTYSDGGARIYSVETRDRKPTTSSQYLQLSPHSEEAWSAAFSPRGHLVFTGLILALMVLVSPPFCRLKRPLTAATVTQC